MRCQLKVRNRVFQFAPLAACVIAALATQPSIARSASAPLTPEGDTARPAAVLPVANCADDGGPGTLRSVVALAASGDTVDLSDLGCSTITLQSGEIEVNVDDLTIQGPGQGALTIDGGGASRVLRHYGAGTLTVSGVTIAHGYVYSYDQSSYGGCILSSGNVSLVDSTVTSCKAITANSNIRLAQTHGGGISSGGEVSLLRSTVSDCQAINGVPPYNGTIADGGGVFTVNGLATVVDSVIANNRAEVSYGPGIVLITQASAGGLAAFHGAVITGSVISGNFAGCDSATQYCWGAVGGGLRVFGGDLTMSSTRVYGNIAESRETFGNPASIVNGGGIDLATNNAEIVDSVISGNRAQGASPHRWGGGLLIEGGSVSITGTTFSDNYAEQGGGIFTLSDLSVTNSTISGNEASGRGGAILIASENYTYYAFLTLANSTVTANVSTGPNGGAGIVDNHERSLGPIVLQSSIVAGNSNAVAGARYDADIGSSYSNDPVIGSSNLVVAATGIALPGDTIQTDPMLGPLQDNGGPTWTHALLPGSPAIDAGNNNAGLDFDQRGAGFARVSGLSADIGSYETQVGPPDRIFADGFETPVMPPR